MRGGRRTTSGALVPPGRSCTGQAILRRGQWTLDTTDSNDSNSSGNHGSGQARTQRKEIILEPDLVRQRARPLAQRVPDPEITVLIPLLQRPAPPSPSTPSGDSCVRVPGEIRSRGLAECQFAAAQHRTPICLRGRPATGSHRPDMCPRAPGSRRRETDQNDEEGMGHRRSNRSRWLWLAGPAHWITPVRAARPIGCFGSAAVALH